MTDDTDDRRSAVDETEPHTPAGASRPTSDSAPTTVITGFEPFFGRTRNRSWDLVDRLPAEPGVAQYQLPVDLMRVREMVLGILAENPRAVLMIGEAPTPRVRVEQLALNVADSERPDNAGRMPQNEQLVEGAPLALRTSWNARAVAGRMHQEGIPAVVSFHAGTFACNAALYHALHEAATRGTGRTAQAASDQPVPMHHSNGARPGAPAIGLLHIPNGRGAAGLGSANLAKAVTLAVATLLEGSRSGGR